MKFSDLHPIKRTQLAALAAAGSSGLTTDRLSKASPLNGDCSRGAHNLCGLRELGLAYSQDRGTAQYATWRITSVGMAVFEGRPNGDVLVVPEGAELSAAPAAPASKLYRVIKDGPSSVQVDTIDTAVEAEALDLLALYATRHPGEHYRLVTTIATAHLPKPAATITRL